MKVKSYAFIGIKSKFELFLESQIELVTLSPTSARTKKSQKKIIERKKVKYTSGRKSNQSIS